MMNLAETWKKIPNYDIYFVSNKGRVKSVRNGKETYIFQSKNDRGYLYVSLYKNNIRKNYRVHRLVAEAFLPNQNHFLEVNHIDENKANNNVENLEWCTHKYNSSYGTRTSRIIPKTIEKTRTPVDQYDLDGNLIKEWYSMNEASRTLNLIQQNISKCCHGKRNTVGGFKWKFHVEKEGD